MGLPENDRYVYLLFAGMAPDPFYVGVGKHGTRRHERHGKQAGKEKYNQPKQQFILDCKAAGIEIVEVIDEICMTLDEAYAREVELIARYGRRELGGCLYNLDAGGFGGRDPVPSTREKLSAANRGREYAPPSAETRAKISAANLGKKMPPEATEKTAAANRGKKLSPAHCAKMRAANLGKKHTPEHIEKVAAANRGKKLPPFSAEHRANMSAAKLGKKRGRYATRASLPASAAP